MGGGRYAPGLVQALQPSILSDQCSVQGRHVLYAHAVDPWVCNAKCTYSNAHTPAHIPICLCVILTYAPPLPPMRHRGLFMCAQQRKRTEEELAAKYLQPLGKPRKFA